MNKFLLLSGAAVLSFALHTPANADTKLIYNQDTGASVGLGANNEIIGETKVQTQTEVETSADVTAENDDDSDETSTEARGGVLVDIFEKLRRPLNFMRSSKMK
jgi:hypothetical protein